jgi:hypothetical protein
MNFRVSMAIVLTAGVLAGCSDKKTQTPTAPTTPTRQAQSLSISGSATLEESETVTLGVSVRYSTGATETVTQGVVWLAENPAVATVNANGVVTALAPGQGGIRATFDGVSATFTLTVRAGSGLIGGRVHESKPTESIGIARATLTAVDANGTSQSATTDADGNFTMRLSNGPAAFSIAAPGYEAAQVLVSIPRDRGSALSLSLTPSFKNVVDVHERNLSAAPTNQRIYKVPVHHAGLLTVQITDAGALSDGWDNGFLEVRDDRNVLVAQQRGSFDIDPFIQITAVAGTMYEVKLLVASRFSPSFVFNVYRLAFEIKHPS